MNVECAWINYFEAENKRRGGPPRIDIKTIYCVTEGPGMPVKIGIATNFKGRYSTLKNATWRDVIVAWTAAGTMTHETALKKLLADMRLRGEWFRDRDDDIKTMLPKTGGNIVEVIAELATGRPLPRGLFTFKAAKDHAR